MNRLVRSVGDSRLMKGVKGTAVGHRIQSRPQPSRWLSTQSSVQAPGSSGVCLARSVVRTQSVSRRGPRVTPSVLIVAGRRRRRSGPVEGLGAGQRFIVRQVSRGTRHSEQESCSSHPRTAAIGSGAALTERQRSNYRVHLTAGVGRAVDTGRRRTPAAGDAERWADKRGGGSVSAGRVDQFRAAPAGGNAWHSWFF
jgi:hypothetical protein